MKKSYVKIAILITTLFILLSTGCKNLINNTGTSSVILTIQTEDLDSSRTAVPTANPSDYYWELSVQTSNGIVYGERFSDGIYEYPNVFIFNDLASGKYIFSVKGYDSEGGSQIFEGTQTVTVSGNTVYSEKIIAKYMNDPDQYGQINLKIYGDSQYISGIKVVYNIHTQINLNKPSGNIDYFYLDHSIHPGNYDFNFMVYGNSDILSNGPVLLCTIKQKVCVRAGVITNKWVNTGEVFFQTDEETGETKFVLNKETISKYIDTQVYVSSGFNSLLPGDDSTGNGSWKKPFSTLSKAIDKIEYINDGVSQYTIWIDGEINDPELYEDFGYLIYIDSVQLPLNLNVRGLKLDSECKDCVYGNNNGFIYVNNSSQYNSAYVTLNISDLQIKNCTNGTILLNDRTSDVTIEGCDFIDNWNLGYGDFKGGAAVRYKGIKTLTLKNCKFSNNYIGGSNVDMVTGGAVCIENSSTVNMLNCHFDNNYIQSLYPSMGGALYIGANCTGQLENCKFTGNYITNSSECFGGAIYVEGTANLISTEITGNYCAGSNNDGHGVYVSNNSGSKLNVGGKVVIYNNFNSEVGPEQKNLVIARGTIGFLASPVLSSTSKIGYSFVTGNYENKFNPDSESPVSPVITNGFKQTKLNPSDVFVSDDDYVMIWDSLKQEVVAVSLNNSISFDLFENLEFHLNKTVINKQENSTEEQRKITVTPKVGDNIIPLSQLTNKTIKISQNGSVITNTDYFSVSSNDFTVVLSQNCPPGNYQMEISCTYKDRKYITTSTIKYIF